MTKPMRANPPKRKPHASSRYGRGAADKRERWRALTSGQRSTKTAVSKLVLVTFPELNQAFDVGERLTLLLPVSFDPVKGVDLIFQLPSRKLSRGCIFDKNAHTTQCFEKIWLLTYSRHQIAVN